MKSGGRIEKTRHPAALGHFAFHNARSAKRPNCPPARARTGGCRSRRPARSGNGRNAVGSRHRLDRGVGHDPTLGCFQGVRAEGTTNLRHHKIMASARVSCLPIGKALRRDSADSSVFARERPQARLDRGEQCCESPRRDPNGQCRRRQARKYRDQIANSLLTFSSSSTCDFSAVSHICSAVIASRLERKDSPALRMAELSERRGVRVFVPICRQR